ncbi:MAG: DinB family protein [Anaerolineales bacterium]|nr:DinB family protein [Anaerolineales bacterium]
MKQSTPVGNKASSPTETISANLMGVEMNTKEWTEVLCPLLSLALRLEGEGQYNLAKLARSAVDSLGRQAAYQPEPPTSKQSLLADIDDITRALAGLDMNRDLVEALRRGATALAEGRLPLLSETPHPYVCRTCGYLVIGETEEKCPTCGAWPETFQWFAPIYWLEALDPFAALETLRQTPEKISALLEGLSEYAMTVQPADGGWAVRNIITHLRDAQGVLEYRLDLFQKQENPILESKAVFEWATREEERPPFTREIFESYKETRARIISRLEALPEKGWRRIGYHEEFGVVSIKQQVSYFASHELTHLPQLERLRAQL